MLADGSTAVTDEVVGDAVGSAVSGAVAETESAAAAECIDRGRDLRRDAAAPPDTTISFSVVRFLVILVS